MKATSIWLRTDEFVKKYFSDTGLSEVKNTRITAYTQIWQLEETKNDYWSNEGQDYIENNQHKKICRILENESNTVTISWSDESHEQMAKNWPESLKTIFWYRSVRSREHKNNSLHADLTTWKHKV